jgi:thiol-disulfide isomerase/thioredoxin
VTERSNKSWIVGVLLLAGFVGMAIGVAKLLGYDPGASEPGRAMVGEPAPEVALPLVSGAGADEGDRVGVTALRGRVVLLDFWASWCAPCRQSIPALNQVHERYGSRIEMYGVNVQPELDAAEVREAHRDFGAAFPTLHDERQEAQAAYGITNIPTLVLIDRDGVVRAVERGVPDPDAVGERIEELLER